MDKITLILTERDFDDLSHALIIVMKELDKHKKGSERIFSDRLEVLLADIEIQALQCQKRQAGLLLHSNSLKYPLE